MSGGAEAGLAVVLRLDAAAEAALAPVSQDMPWPPHVTLAVMDPAAPEAPLHEAVESLAVRWAPLPVSFASLGVFPGGVRFLAPVPTPELLTRHTALLDALGALRPQAHYDRGAWVPHVTIGGEGALGLLPLRAVLGAIELVRFPPARSLLCRALTG